ncbi:RluA family pseudouridine synthase [Chelatococcus reniformis]|uniref:RNA pseudouridine synthase n=1 Tax=Chelatococcus reniformis TaxID=1494448 RepID=A0A916TXH4_9HYPH|nr:RNA pseudouridine synthase [Chelatococcus reniformis]GGC49865.1 RNA pseudouridine synthase [Chelatococcus reniformis]
MTEDELRTTLPQRLLYRDGLMLIVDKPAGIPVHRGPKAADWQNGPALEAAFDALQFGLPRPPALAHRLDRDTSGCLVLGRHRKALEQLFHLFRQGRVDKTYWAVVEGMPDGDEGLIDLPLGRRDPSRGWWMKVDAAGLPAQTRWRVRGHAEVDGARRAWLELMPLTGRTHQLRVHCAAMGWPIVGDAVYGTAPRFGGPGLHLHARAIAVPLQPSKPAVAVEAPAPGHMAERLAACGWG